MKNVTILVVDDTTAFREDIRDFIEFGATDYGYEALVIEAKNGAEALSIIKKNPIDLVVTDGDMPIMSGFELIQAISCMENAPALILLSGNEERVPEMKKQGVNALMKPIEGEKLLALAFSLLPKD